jgi:transposase
MAKGRAVAIVLEATEKSELAALTRKHGAPQALAERARIILAAASGLNNKEIADKVGVCAATVGTWRNRFAEGRMDGLYDEPRPGAPREIGDDEIAAMIRKTLETRPKGATHWSLRAMGKEIGHAPYRSGRLGLILITEVCAMRGSKPSVDKTKQHAAAYVKGGATRARIKHQRRVDDLLKAANSNLNLALHNLRVAHALRPSAPASPPPWTRRIGWTGRGLV